MLFIYPQISTYIQINVYYYNQIDIITDPFDPFVSFLFIYIIYTNTIEMMKVLFDEHININNNTYKIITFAHT